MDVLAFYFQSMPSLQPYTSPLGQRLAAHLLRRTTYATDKDLILEYAAKTPQQALDDLLDIQPPSLPEPLDHLTGQHYINSGIAPVAQNYLLRANIRSWWMEEAIKDHSIGHKLEFFLHSILVSRIEESGDRSGMAFDHLQLFRLCSTRFSTANIDMDSYKELAYRMTTDNVMLRYLDGAYNHKWAPNENYAREFFELFTIGRGEQIGPEDYTNYTEGDILEAARLLTGWRVWDRPYASPSTDPEVTDPETGLQRGYPDYNRHDVDSKQFSAAFQNTIIEGASNQAGMWTELREFVDMIFNQDATAQNLCRRLYRYFVHDIITPEIESDIIAPLAVTLKSNDYKLSVALRQLLESQHFYDKDDADDSNGIIGGLIKSPMDMLLGTMSFFKIDRPDTNTNALEHYRTFYHEFVFNGMFVPAGLSLFDPPSVAGYAAYHQEPVYSKNWFNSATLIARYKQPQRMLSAGSWNGGVQLDLIDFVANSGIVSNPADGTALVNELIACLFCESPTQARADYFLNDVFLDGLSLINWQFEWQNYVNTGNESSVCIPVKALLTAILSSQEYGCM